MLEYETTVKTVDAIRESLESWKKVREINESGAPTDEDFKNLMSLCFDNYLDMIRTICYILERESPSDTFRDFASKLGIEIELASVTISDKLGIM